MVGISTLDGEIWLNPIGLITLGVTLLLHMLLFILARNKDRWNKFKVFSKPSLQETHSFYDSYVMMFMMYYLLTHVGTKHRNVSQMW